MRGNTNVRCCSVRHHDPGSQNDGDETSSLPLEEEVHRAPFPLTMSETSGLLKGKHVRGVHIQKS